MEFHDINPDDYKPDGEDPEGYIEIEFEQLLELTGLYIQSDAFDWGELDEIDEGDCFIAKLYVEQAVIESKGHIETDLIVKKFNTQWVPKGYVGESDVDMVVEHYKRKG